MKKFSIAPIDWDLNAFEPNISYQTMLVHVTQLHKKYVDNLNTLLTKGYPQLAELDAADVLRNVSFYFNSEEDKQFYLNNMGGHFCHTLFWYCLSPKGTTKPTAFFDKIGRTRKQVDADLKSEGLKRFGSGWSWLALDTMNRLNVSSTQNHYTPFMKLHRPILCVDLWEHAYFLDRFGNRSEWLDIILKYIDWSKVEQIYVALINNRRHPISNLLTSNT